MADSTEKVTYEFEVKSDQATKKLDALSQAFDLLQKSSDTANDPVLAFGQVLKTVAAGLQNISEKEFNSFTRSINSAIAPTKVLTNTFKELAAEQNKLYGKFTFAEKYDKAISDASKDALTTSKQHKASMTELYNEQDRIRKEQDRITKEQEAQFEAQFAQEVRRSIEPIKRKAHELRELSNAYKAVLQAGKLSATPANIQNINALIAGAQNPVKALLSLAKKISHEQDTLYGKITSAEKEERELARATKEVAERTKEHKRNMQELLDAQEHQNDKNAPLSGVIHVDKATKSAAESAAIFEQAFSKPTKLASIIALCGKFANKLAVIVQVAKKAIEVVKKLAQVFAKQLSKSINFALIPLKAIIKTLSTLHNVLFRHKGSTSSLSQLFKIGAGVGVGKLLADATKNATELAESINMFTQVLHENNEEGDKFVNFLSEMSGLDATKLRDTTSMFYEMFIATVDNARDEAGKAAMKISKDLTVMSIDIASLFNKEADEVAENLISGMRGMSRSVVKYGMDLRNSTVEAYAKSKLGITENFRTMNEANREVLRYLVMLHQASDAQSDFAKTIESPANQLKIFKNQVLGVSREVGRFIVHVLAPALPVINGFAMALRLMLKAIADFLGIWNGLTTKSEEGAESFDDASAGLDGLGASAGGAAKKIKQLLAPFDELNVLAEQAAGGSGSGESGYGIVDPQLLALLDETESKFTKIQMAAHNARDRILEFFGLEYVFDPLNGVMDYVRAIPGEFADNLISAFQAKNFTQVGSIIADKVNEITQMLADKLSWKHAGPIITRKLTNLFDSLNSFIATYNWSTLGQIFGNAIKTTLETIDFAGLKFDWSGFGKAVANSLGSFIQSANLSKVGTILATWLNGLVEFAANFDQEFPWDDFSDTLVSTLNNFFKNWDSTKFGDTANSILNHLLDALTDVVSSEELDWNQIGVKIGEALSRVDWWTLLDKAVEVMWEVFKAKWKLKLGIWTGATSPEDHRNALNPFDQTGTGGRGSFGGTGPITYDPTVRPKPNVPGSSYYSKFGTFDTAFASGGIITGPTRALIGEAGRSEAVIPLDNSPQMNDLVQQIADRVDSQSVVSAIYTLIDAVNSKDLNVNIGDDAIGSSYDRYTRTRGARVDSGVFANAY